MEEWSAMFDAADKDNNGYLSIQELAAKMRECDSKLTDKECVVSLSSLICPLKHTGMANLTGRQNALKLILKSPRFVLFGANLTQRGWQI